MHQTQLEAKEVKALTSSRPVEMRATISQFKNLNYEEDKKHRVTKGHSTTEQGTQETASKTQKEVDKNYSKEKLIRFGGVGDD